ncbi:hypothetical protein ACQ4LE_006190 [Meloidogyne hapla]
MKIKIPRQVEEWSSFFDNSDGKEENQKPKIIILEKPCCNYLQHMFYCFVILLLFIVLIVVISQNNGNKENEIKIEKMQKEIEKMIKEQEKLNDKITTLENENSFFNVVLKHHIKNFEEKNDVIEMQIKEIFEFLNKSEIAKFNLEETIVEQSRKMAKIQMENAYIIDEIKELSELVKKNNTDTAVKEKKKVFEEKLELFIKIMFATILVVFLVLFVMITINFPYMK